MILIEQKFNIKMILAILVFLNLLGCKNEELEKLKAENVDLKAKVTSLKTEVTQLKNSDINIYAEGKGKCDNAQNQNEWKDSLNLLRECEVDLNKVISQYPNSKSAENARKYLPTLKRRIEAESLAVDFYESMDKKDIPKAESTLKMTKKYSDILDQADTKKMAEYFQRRKNAPQVFASHEEFYKASQTGMTVGKRYGVYTCQHEDGGRLVTYRMLGSTNIRAPDKIVYFEDSFGTERARELFEYRGKCLCFVVRMMSSSKIWVEDFYPGECEG